MLDKLNKAFGKHSDWGVVFLRLGIGIVFLVHGLGKLLNIGPVALGITNTAGFFANIGIPAALFFAWVVALVETFGGLFVLVGLFTRISSILLVIDMLVAVLLVHLPKGFVVNNGGYEFALVLLLGAISLVLSGAGTKFVIENKLLGK